MLVFWRMRSTPSLPSLPGPLWPWVVAHDKALSMGQIELSCVLMLNWIVWNRAIFETRTHACHHGLAFSNSILYWVLFRAIPGVFPSQVDFQILVFHLNFIYSIGLCYILSVQMFYSKIIFLHLLSVVCLSSSFLHLLVGRIFFWYFEITSFVCFVRIVLSIVWVSLLTPPSPQVILSDTFVFFSVFSFKHILAYFSFLSIFVYRSSFFTCSSSLISPSRLCIFSGSIEEHQFYHRLISYPHKLARLLQWCYQLECFRLRYLLIIRLTFRFLP